MTRGQSPGRCAGGCGVPLQPLAAWASSELASDQPLAAWASRKPKVSDQPLAHAGGTFLAALRYAPGASSSLIKAINLKKQDMLHALKEESTDYAWKSE